MRLFLATFIDLQQIDPDNNLDQLKSFFSFPLKFVAKDNIHLTWKFIGEVKQEDLNKIIEEIDKSIDDSSDIKIQFDKSEIWPNKRTPRQIVITGKDINNNGANFYDSLNNNLTRVDIKAEKRKFNPHITFARFRKNGDQKNNICFPENICLKQTALEFVRFELVESMISSKGSTYNIIESFNLNTLHNKKS